MYLIVNFPISGAPDSYRSHNNRVQIVKSSGNSGRSRILKRGGNNISKVDLRILDSGGGEALEG